DGRPMGVGVERASLNTIIYRVGCCFEKTDSASYAERFKRRHEPLSGDLLSGKSMSIDEIARFIDKEIDDLRGAVTALEAITEHASRKFQNERMQSIWGFIKYYICLWFYDPKKEVEKIRASTPQKHIVYDEVYKILVDDVVEKILAFDVDRYVALSTSNPQN